MRRVPEVVHFPRCNKSDIDWYLRIPTDPSSADAKDEMQPKLYEQEDATLKPTFNVTDSYLPH